jgi:hypothetical protein
MPFINKFGGAAPSRVTDNAWAGVRGIYAGSYTSANNDTIDYVTIASVGNSTDFGNIITDRRNLGGCAGNGRGLIMGGWTSYKDEIEYITIASTGNSVDFGNLTVARYAPDGVSNGTRGVCLGGQDSGGRSNVMDYVTIASAGNATDFGDLTDPRIKGAGISNLTRGVFAGGES